MLSTPEQWSPCIYSLACLLSPLSKATPVTFLPSVFALAATVPCLAGLAKAFHIYLQQAAIIEVSHRGSWHIIGLKWSRTGRNWFYLGEIDQQRLLPVIGRGQRFSRQIAGRAGRRNCEVYGSTSWKVLLHTSQEKCFKYGALNKELTTALRNNATTGLEDQMWEASTDEVASVMKKDVKEDLKKMYLSPFSTKVITSNEKLRGSCQVWFTI